MRILYYSSSEINAWVGQNKNKLKILPTEGGRTPQIFPEEEKSDFSQWKTNKIFAVKK